MLRSRIKTGFTQNEPKVSLKQLFTRGKSLSILDRPKSESQKQYDLETLKKCDQGSKFYTVNETKQGFKDVKKNTSFEAEGVFRTHQIVVKERRNEGSRDLWRKKIKLSSFQMCPRQKKETGPARHLDDNLLEKFKKRNFSVSHLNLNKEKLDDKHQQLKAPEKKAESSMLEIDTNYKNYHLKAYHHRNKTLNTTSTNYIDLFGKNSKKRDQIVTITRPNTISTENLNTASSKNAWIEKKIKSHQTLNKNLSCHTVNFSDSNKIVKKHILNTEEAFRKRENKYYLLYGRDPSKSHSRVSQSKKTQEMLESTFQDEDGSTVFDHENTIKDEIHEKHKKDKLLLRYKKTSDIFKDYEMGQRKKITKKLKQVNSIANKQFNERNKINETYKNNQTICEKDRNRIGDFFTNEWINNLINRKTEDLTENVNIDLENKDLDENKKNKKNNKYFDKFGNTDNLKYMKDLQNVFKDIRYCYYKYYDGKTTLKYSKEKACETIFKRAYPHLGTKQILTYAEKKFQEDLIRKKIVREIKDDNKGDIKKKRKLDLLEQSMAMIAKAEVEDSIDKQDEERNNCFKKLSDFIRDKTNRQKIFRTIDIDFSKLTLRHNKKLKNTYNFIQTMSDICKLKYSDIVESNFFKLEVHSTYNAIYLFTQIKNENTEKVTMLLKQNPALVFNINEDLETALHMSVHHCGLNMIRLIQSYYPNVNARDRKGRTALYYAMGRRSKALIMLLLKHRSNIYEPCVGNFQGFCEKIGLFEFYKFIERLTLLVQKVSYKRRWQWWHERISIIADVTGETLQEKNT